jgi:GNAT superfamily N-acetyltransferase
MRVNTSISIRSATAKEVYDLFRSYWELRGIIPGLMDTDRLKKCDVLFVAEYSGTIAGVVALASDGCDGSTGPTLATLFTLPEFQRRGVGRSLCEFGIRRFLELGNTPIACDVTTHAMHSTIRRLPVDLQAHLRLDLSFDRDGDEWESFLATGEEIELDIPDER